MRPFLSGKEIVKADLKTAYEVRDMRANLDKQASLWKLIKASGSQSGMLQAFRELSGLIVQQKEIETKNPTIYADLQTVEALGIDTREKPKRGGFIQLDQLGAQRPR